MYLLETDEARKYNVQESGFNVEIELAAQSASTKSLAEVPISYRPRIGTRKLSTWRDGPAIFSAAFRLARQYNPILLYSGLAGLSVIPAILIFAGVTYAHYAFGIFQYGWAIAGTLLFLVGADSLALAGMAVLTRHTEERLMKEILNNREAQSKSNGLGHGLQNQQ